MFLPRALLVLFFLSLTPLPASEPPNVVFILADDLGWSDTSLYGQTSFYETPNLERLAARGMTFDRAYTASPLCSPTRSSILTGLHPARTGLTTPNCHTPGIVLQATAAATAPPDRKLTAYESVSRLDTTLPTLSRHLQSAGFATGHFGKWHLGASPYSPLEHGFDVDLPHHHGPGPAGSYVAPWKFAAFTEAYPGEHIEDRMGDEAVRFLESQRDSPFFLNYWQFSVHSPFDAKAGLIEKHRARLDPSDAQRSPTYAAMVESLDDNVGKVLDAIDRLGLANSTIIVFFSDNGGNMYNEIDGTTPTSNRPLRGGKGNAWDGGTRVPAVVVWPGVTSPGSRSDALLTSTDFYPTLLEMTGLEPAPGQTFDGLSMVPALRGEAMERDAIFTFFPHSTKVPDTLPPSAAIYEGSWKLLRLFHHGPSGEHEYRLFHLASDIGERHDLATSEPERVASMDARLQAFLDDCDAVVPRLNPLWDPTRARLAALGWRPAKDCSLQLGDEALHITSTGDDPSLVVTLPEPVPPGDLELHVRLRPSFPGRLELRWQEQGARPPFHKNRFASSPPLDSSSGWTDLVIPFTTSRPVIAFRLDPGTAPGEIFLASCSLTRAGATKHAWNFTSALQATVAAAAPATSAPAESFVPIFNGTDLTGWEGSPAYWSVEDGSLTGVTDGSLDYNRFLTWKGGTVRNFELRAQVKVTPGGNSGLQYRGKERPDLGEFVVTGYQCDVVANRPDYNGMLYEERGRRILAQTGQRVTIDPDGQPWVVASMPVPQFPPGEWHDYRIRVEANHHRHWIDGQPTVDVVDLDPIGRSLEGVLAVQVHVGPAMKIQYRDLQLLSLPDDLPLETAADHPIPAEAVWVRPQRRLPKNWTPPQRGELWMDLLATAATPSGTVTCGGRPLRALSPPLTLPPLALPTASHPVLRAYLGFQDPAQPAAAPAPSAAKPLSRDFILFAGEREIFRQTHTPGEWLPVSIDLTEFAGQEIPLRFHVEPAEPAEPTDPAAAWAIPALWNLKNPSNQP